MIFATNHDNHLKMSQSSNNSRFMIEEKIKELKLSEEEQAAFRKAKLQIQNHCVFFMGFFNYGLF